MWMVPPEKMCRQHLLGEHVELHMFVGAINKGKRLNHFAENNYLDSRKIKSRHSAIVKEMKRRGYNHQSPLEYQDKLKIGKVDAEKSYKDLLARCPECRRIAMREKKNESI